VLVSILPASSLLSYQATLQILFYIYRSNNPPSYGRVMLKSFAHSAQYHAQTPPDHLMLSFAYTTNRPITLAIPGNKAEPTILASTPPTTEYT
jgi:hypothetical protein